MIARKHPRFAVQLPASFSGENISGNGTVVNLSAGGCAMIGESGPAVSSYISLTIELSGNESPVAVELASVRWSSGSSFGVAFIRMEGGEEARLQAFVKTLAA